MRYRVKARARDDLQRLILASPLSLSERLRFGSVLSGRSVCLSVDGGLTLFVAVDQVV